jgi:hypothetical protein
VTPSLQAKLLEEITVHCFACPETRSAFTPVDAHDLMEEHYAQAHSELIARLVGQ